MMHLTKVILINGPYDLKFYVKQAMACQNLLIYTDGYCAFTRLTGEQPRTPIDVATMDQPNIHLDNASPCDKKFIADLQGFFTQYAPMDSFYQ